MKTFIAVVLVAVVGLTGCGTIKAITGGQPDAVTRILADIGCVTAAAQAGLQIAGDPSVNDAKTASGVLTAIASVGTSNIPASVLAACQATLGFAAQDAAAAAQQVAAGTGTTAPQLTPPAKRGAAPPIQPKAPTPVVVPLPKKG